MARHNTRQEQTGCGEGQASTCDGVSGRVPKQPRDGKIFFSSGIGATNTRRAARVAGFTAFVLCGVCSVCSIFLVVHRDAKRAERWHPRSGKLWRARADVHKARNRVISPATGRHHLVEETGSRYIPNSSRGPASFGARKASRRIALLGLVLGIYLRAKKCCLPTEPHTENNARAHTLSDERL